MRIVVTGGAGFMGSWLAESLAKQGHHVWAIDNGQGGRNHPAGFTVGVDPPSETAPTVLTWNDLADEGSDLTTHLGGFQPEVLVHLAANAREGASQFQPEYVTRSNLWAYVRTLRACIAGGRLQRVVFFSSMARYGKGEGPPPFNEDMKPQPEDVYASNKVASEGVTRALGAVHNFKHCIVVPHNVFGIRQCFDRYRNVVTIFANNVMRGEPITIYGDGTQRRAFSYIDDSLPCYLAAVDGAADGHTVNIGGQVPITINALADAVREDMGVPTHPIKYTHQLRPLEVDQAWCTTALSEQLLGYKETVGWREGVRRTCTWAKAQGPQDWTQEPLELRGPNLPETWR